MSEFTKDCLRFCVRVGNDRPETFNIATANNPDANIASLAAFALAQQERAENAEKRMKAWGCPDEDFICLNCGRETPCMTEADLKPGDPGVPCTFDLTYPQMIERIHYHEDQQRRAEAERDRLKVELGEAEEAIRDLTDSGDAMRFSMPTAAMAGEAGWDASRRHAAVRRAMERGK